MEMEALRAQHNSCMTKGQGKKNNNKKKKKKGKRTLTLTLTLTLISVSSAEVRWSGSTVWRRSSHLKKKTKFQVPWQNGTHADGSADDRKAVFLDYMVR